MSTTEVQRFLVATPTLLGHRGLGEGESPCHIRHKRHRLVHRIELNGIVQEKKIRLVAGVPFHLADHPLLLFPVCGAQGLCIKPAEFRLLADPIERTIECEMVVDLKHREVHPIMPRRQGNVPRLGRGELCPRADLDLLIVGDLVQQLEVHREADLLQHLAYHGGLHRQILGSDQDERSSVGIARLP